MFHRREIRTDRDLCIPISFPLRDKPRYESGPGGDWLRNKCLRARARGTVFDSLSRLRYSGPFHFDTQECMPHLGGCVSKFRKCTMPPASVRLFFIVSLFHSTRFSYVWYGYVPTTETDRCWQPSAFFRTSYKVLALKDGQETKSFLPLIFGLLATVSY